MKKFKAFLKFYWNWILYCWATQDDKFLYYVAQDKGMRALSARPDALGGFIVKYDPNYPPQEKSWLSWEEYKYLWHPTTGFKYVFPGLSSEEYHDLVALKVRVQKKRREEKA